MLINCYSHWPMSVACPSVPQAGAASHCNNLSSTYGEMTGAAHAPSLICPAQNLYEFATAQLTTRAACPTSRSASAPGSLMLIAARSQLHEANAQILKLMHPRPLAPPELAVASRPCRPSELRARPRKAEPHRAPPLLPTGEAASAGVVPAQPAAAAEADLAMRDELSAGRRRFLAAFCRRAASAGDDTAGERGGPPAAATAAGSGGPPRWGLPTPGPGGRSAAFRFFRPGENPRRGPAVAGAGEQLVGRTARWRPRTASSPPAEGEAPARRGHVLGSGALPQRPSLRMASALASLSGAAAESGGSMPRTERGNLDGGDLDGPPAAAAGIDWPAAAALSDGQSEAVCPPPGLELQRCRARRAALLRELAEAPAARPAADTEMPDTDDAASPDAATPEPLRAAQRLDLRAPWAAAAAEPRSGPLSLLSKDAALIARRARREPTQTRAGARTQLKEGLDRPPTAPRPPPAAAAW